MSKSFACIVSVFFILSCSVKHEDKKSNAETQWPGMDSFHMIMAETFHPYMDSSNLKPIKEHAEDLKIEAIKWAESPLPDRVNSDEVKEGLLELKTKAATLAALTKTGSDEEIASMLKDVHDRFHKLQEAWYAGDGEHEHH